MIKHIVLWKFRQELSENEKQSAREKIKFELENLNSVIKGIVSIKVNIDLIDTSTCDAILETLFDTKESLINYKEHPEHIKVSSFVKEVVETRLCADYII